MKRIVDRSKWVSPNEYAKWAELGRAYTKMMLSDGPSNQGIHPILWAKNVISRQSYSDDETDYRRPGTSGTGEAASIHDAALRTKTGNCTEHASVAFTYLYRLGIRPLVMLGYSAGLDNHMLVAVGLDLDAYNFAQYNSDYPNWKKEIHVDKSWICDPWKNTTYLAAPNFYAFEPNAKGIIQIRAWAV